MYQYPRKQCLGITCHSSVAKQTYEFSDKYFQSLKNQSIANNSFIIILKNVVPKYIRKPTDKHGNGNPHNVQENQRYRHKKYHPPSPLKKNQFISRKAECVCKKLQGCPFAL